MSSIKTVTFSIGAPVVSETASDTFSTSARFWSSVRPSSILTVTYGIMDTAPFLENTIIIAERRIQTMANEEKPKQKVGFTIIKNDPTDGHKGYGIGSLSLENVSPLFIDVEEQEAFIDIGAMHARSEVERGIKFTTNPEDSAGGKDYWLVWITIDFNPEGPYYAGVAACEMVVN